MNILASSPAYLSPLMISQFSHDPSSGNTGRKHRRTNTATFLDRQNAQRKRQKRQTAGALVTGLFGTHKSVDGSPGDAQSTAKKTPKKKSTAQPRPQIEIPPRGIGPVHEPNVNDVLCGRGGRINSHEGNVRFRQIVVDNKKDYLAPSTKKLEKAHIAAEIVRGIRSRDPPGRFLKEESDGWYDIGDAKAIKKVGQALREDAPDIRQEIGSDEEDHGTGDGKEGSSGTINASPTAAQRQPSSRNEVKVTSTPQTITSVPITTAIAISGRGAKMITTSGSHNSVSSQQGIDSQANSFQHTVPPSQPQRKQNFPEMLGGRSAGVSGAAAAAISSDVNSNFPAEDIAFGRPYHVPETGGESSMISGMSGGTGAGGATSALSGMSGISALTDPMSSLSADLGHGRPGPFQPPAGRPQNAQQFQAIRMSQLQQARQNWQHGLHGSTRTMNTLNSSDLRSVAGLSLQRSLSWQSGYDLQMDVMSWAEHSLVGGGIRDVGSVMSGQQSFHSYYLRDGSVAGGNAQIGFTSSGRAGSMGPPQPAQHHIPAPARLYHVGSTGSNEENRGRTERLVGGNAFPSSNASVTSMSIASVSLGGSIMSDLSENLNALDLAEPRMLGHFEGDH